MRKFKNLTAIQERQAAEQRKKNYEQHLAEVTKVTGDPIVAANVLASRKKILERQNQQKMMEARKVKDR